MYLILVTKWYIREVRSKVINWLVIGTVVCCLQPPLPPQPRTSGGLIVAKACILSKFCCLQVVVVWPSLLIVSDAP